MLVLGTLTLAAARPSVAGQWVTGDVAVAAGRGRYQVRDRLGTLKDDLNTGFTEYTTGCAFDAQGNLHVTAYNAGYVVVFEAAEPHAIIRSMPTNLPGDDQLPESILFDAQGREYVSHAGGDMDVHLYAPDGTFLREFDVWTDRNGSDWIDLARDGVTLHYTSESRRILRHDLANDLPLPDFADLTPTPGQLRALRLLPPGDGSTGLLAADKLDVKRFDRNGTVVRTYDVPDHDFWFALALDPDGTSFWSGDKLEGKYYKFDLETGVVLRQVNTQLPSGELHGLCVLGERTAALPCGDHVIDRDEQCDDGNRLPNDGCDGFCQLELSPCTSGGGIPEVAYDSVRLRRVGRLSDDVAISFPDSLVGWLDRVNVYRGSIASLGPPSPYDHGAAGCGLLASPFIDRNAVAVGMRNEYYLVVNACADTVLDREGPYGYGLGPVGPFLRPSTSDLGTTTCP